MSLYKWSKTAVDNDDADATINWAEGMAPSAVNNSSRAEMAAVAKARDDWAGALTTGGTSTAYTLTSNQVFDSLANMSGDRLTVRFNATNGASATLNVDGLGAKAIQTVSGTAVPAGQLLANSVWQLTYDDSIPAWLLHGYTPMQITGLTALTAPAIDDELPIYDLSATTNKKITLADALEVINGLTEDTAPHVSNDFLVSYDASAAAAKKLTLTNLVAAFLTAGMTSRNTAKAYAIFTESADTVSFNSATQGFNVSTIVRDSTANYTVTFTNALPTANYVPIITGTTSTGANGLTAVLTDVQTTSFSFNTKTTTAGDNSDVVSCRLVVYGY